VALVMRLLAALACAALCALSFGAGMLWQGRDHSEPLAYRDKKAHVVGFRPLAPQLDLQQECHGPHMTRCEYHLLMREHQTEVDLRKGRFENGRERVDHYTFVVSDDTARTFEIGEKMSADEIWEWQNLLDGSSFSDEPKHIASGDEALEKMRQLVKDRRAWGKLTRWQVQPNGKYMNQVGEAKPLPA
jgi:hypothetical protein